MNASFTPPPLVAEVASTRARLWDAGFRPVTIYNPTTPCKSPGKQPVGAEWQHRARRDPPEAADAEPTPDALNTGILCDGLRAIDVDVDDAGIAARVRALLVAQFGETAIRTRSNSVRFLTLYRAAEGEPGKRAMAGTAGKVEVLGRGSSLLRSANIRLACHCGGFPRPPAI
jgi:Bifunctional DNA primase/polymerase, N-terminal